jgi:hypothetical protein
MFIMQQPENTARAIRRWLIASESVTLRFDHPIIDGDFLNNDGSYPQPWQKGPGLT